MLRRTFLALLAAVPFWRKKEHVTWTKHNPVPDDEMRPRYGKSDHEPALYVQGGWKIYPTKCVSAPCDLHEGPTHYFTS